MKKPRKWKVNTGGAIMMLGLVLKAATEGCPVAEWVPWLEWIAGIINRVSPIVIGGGAFLTAYGVADRSEKAVKGQT